jgi:thiamine pyrophosphate-dependent acetolactate synthase large subunit-like protein
VIGGTKLAYEGGLPYPNRAGRISFAWLLRMLEAIRPNKSVIVNDLIAAEPHVMESLTLENSFAYFSSNSGSLGYAAAAAVGIELAGPKSTVICLTDDQSTLAYPQVFWTAAFYDANVKFIVINEMGSRNFNIRLNSPGGDIHKGLQQRPVLLAELARSMGLPFQYAADMGTLESSLKTIFETEGPCMLEVRLE